MKRRTFLATAAGASTALALGATGTAAGAGTDALLRRWFRDTYRSIEALTTDFGLAADTMDVTASTLTPSVNTSPTNIGCGLWATVAAGGLGVIDATTMHRRLARTVTAVERLERAHGFWFNWYDAYTGETLTTWPGSGDPVDPFLSSVDNAWLVTGLRIAADAAPELRPRVARLLADADWSFYYTPYDAADPAANPGQLHGGYSTATESFTPTGTARSTPSRAWPVTSASPTARCPVSTTGTPSARWSRAPSRTSSPRVSGSRSTVCGCGAGTTRTGAARSSPPGAGRCSRR